MRHRGDLYCIGTPGESTMMILLSYTAKPFSLSTSSVTSRSATFTNSPDPTSKRSDIFALIDSSLTPRLPRISSISAVAFGLNGGRAYQVPIPPRSFVLRTHASCILPVLVRLRVIKTFIVDSRRAQLSHL